MPKPKLSDAVKTTDATNENTGTAAGNSGGEGATTPAAEGTETSDSSGGDDDDDDDSAPDASSSTETSPPAASTPPAATQNGRKSLADFRSAFGHERGSVYFADELPFEDACVKFIEAQQKTIEAKDAEIEKLQKANRELASGAQGEDTPVGTKTPGAKTESGNPISDFASAQEQKMAAGKAAE